jgi:hypothetical protein
MTIFRQLDMPVWDSLRIGASRWEHLAWMHDHWADRVLSVEELEGSGESETMEHGA